MKQLSLTLMVSQKVWGSAFTYMPWHDWNVYNIELSPSFYLQLAEFPWGQEKKRENIQLFSLERKNQCGENL